MTKVLVTGANGFVGRRMCQALLSAGYPVKGAVRSEFAAKDLPAGTETVFISNLHSEEQWRDTLQDVTSVVHLIGRTHVLKESSPDPEEEYRSVNVWITYALLNAIDERPVEKFIFMSSIKAVGEGGDKTPYTENTPTNPEDYYGKTKLEAEQYISTWSERTGIPSVILRPPLVYGPGVKGNFLRLLKLARKGFPLPVGSIHNLRSLIYVDNLADALTKALSKQLEGCDVFHIADEPPLSTPLLYRELLKNFGKGAGLLPFPESLLRNAAKVAGKEQDYEKIAGSLVVSSEKFRDTFGWKEPFSFESGIRKTCEWYRTKNDQ
ncbi:MAG: NAD-dependent epimerase/dehydratase family protein [Synergistales bacterium]|nr:NAD-dependent epimerase/dehydratase family protein [Synergistales bacterium]